MALSSSAEQGAPPAAEGLANLVHHEAAETAGHKHLGCAALAETVLYLGVHLLDHKGHGHEERRTEGAHVLADCAEARRELHSGAETERGEEVGAEREGMEKGQDDEELLP